MKSFNLYLTAGITILVLIKQTAGKPDADCKLPTKGVDDTCCKYPRIVDESLWYKCSKNLTDKLESHSHLNRACMIAECVTVSTGAFGNDELSSTKAREFVEKSLGAKNEKWVDVIMTGLKACYEKYDKNKDDIKQILGEKPFLIDQTVCNPQYIFISGCIHIELFRNCPRSEYKESTQCNEWKSFLNKCADNYENLKLIAEKVAENENSEHNEDTKMKGTTSTTSID